MSEHDVDPAGGDTEFQRLLDTPLGKLTGKELRTVLGRLDPDALRSGVHVNAGPPGFENSGGHANFDPKSRLTNPAEQLTLPDGARVTLPEGPVDITIRGFRIQR